MSTQDGLNAQPLTTISLDAFAMPDETSVEANASSLQIMSISNDAAYLGFFTKDGFPIEVHWMKEAPGWAPGFVHCLGDECPACKAGLKINRYILLPVLDRITAKVFMLRISTARGPGKLITELGKVLSLPEPEKAIVKVMREDRYTYSVEILGEAEHDPDAIRAVQQFKEQVETGTLDPLASVTSMAHDDMASHPHIEKILMLEGPK